MSFSYGFRPGRSCHDALWELDRILHRRPINFIVDADIEKFSDINLRRNLAV
jgi:RNA-directed DNA polymerase